MARRGVSPHISSDAHDHESEDELTECPDCGAEIAGEESLESTSMPGLRVGPRSVYGEGENDLWLCTNCRATLGVSVGER